MRYLTTPGIGAVLVLFIASGCRCDTNAIEVQHAGCERLVGIPARCEVAGPTELVFWTPERNPTVTGAVVRRLREVEDGTQIVLAISPPTRVTITSEKGRWTGEITAGGLPSALARIDDLRYGGQLDEAQRLVSSLLEHGDATIRARALGKLARLQRQRGEAADAVKALEASMRASAAARDHSAASADRFASIWVNARSLRNHARARHLVDHAHIESVDGDGHAWLAYYDGLAHLESGAFRPALEALRRGARQARRFDLRALRRDILTLQIHLLQSLGRHLEANAAITELRSVVPKTVGCHRALALANLGEYLERAHAAGHGAEDGIQQLDEALRIYAKDCSDPQNHAMALVRLASILAARQDSERATQLLDAAKELSPEPDAWLAIFYWAARGDVSRSAGDADAARAAFERLDAMGSRSDMPFARWRAAVGRAHVELEFGEADEAIRRLRHAEAMLDDRRFLVPLGEGRERFMDEHRLSAQLLVAALVGRGAHREASEVARNSLRRSLEAYLGPSRSGRWSASARSRWYAALSAYGRARKAIDEQSVIDWRLDRSAMAAMTETRSRQLDLARTRLEAVLREVAEETSARARLTSPQTGELQLTVFGEEGAWHVIVADERRTSAHQIDVPLVASDKDELGRLILGPHRDAIRQARRVTVFVPGALSGVDFHALPFDGGPLAGHAPVSYGTDLGVTEVRTSSTVLLVYNPSQDLSHADEEGRRLEELYRRRRVPVTVLAGAEATSERILAALAEGPRIFHFAGHGATDGFDGWSSHLVAAHGKLITLVDILALAAAPDVVVLSSCRTAQTSSTTSSGGQSLASAFVARGARVVVAPTREVEDGLSRRLALELHRNELTASTTPAALAETQTSLASTGTNASAFRALVR